MCNCITKVNKLLIENGSNTKLGITFPLDGRKPKRVLIAVEKLDIAKRSKRVAVMADYCPFCGEKYEPQEGEK